jgi:phosphoglycerol transferase MdoB-like AlkP superfamily enzyme
VLLAAFALARLFFLAVNHGCFSGITLSQGTKLFLKGMAYDTETILYFNFLPLLVLSLPLRFSFSRICQTLVKTWIVLLNCSLLLVDLSDSVYYRFNGKRSTIDLAATMFNANFGKMLPTYLKQYWFVLCAFFLIVVLIVRLYPQADVIAPGAPLPRLSIMAGMLLPTVILMNAASFYTGIGFGIKQRNVYSLAAHVKTEYIPIVINTPWSMVQSLTTRRLPTVTYLSEAEVNKLCCPIVNFKKREPFRKLNVVVIILESFSKSFVTGLDGQERCAPFLNSLMEKGLTFDRTFANARRTHEAVPAVISGIPSLMDEAFINSLYITNTIPSLASLLRAKGYQTSFFHGGENKVLKLNSYAGFAGFASYFGMDEYSHREDFDGSWGIYDEPYLQYVARQLQTSRQPFFAAILTVTSHHPYKLPDGKEKIFNRHHSQLENAIEYTDHALQRFFETASRMPWYNDTLFVLTADHTGPMSGLANRITRYEIPILFYRPGTKLQANRRIICQQIDILPSVLDFLNYDETFSTFGRSVFSDRGDSYAINYLEGIYSLVKDDYLLVASVEKTVGLYNYERDRKLAVNLMDERGYAQLRQEMEQRLKAVNQNFNNRMNLNDFPQPRIRD